MAYNENPYERNVVKSKITNNSFYIESAPKDRPTIKERVQKTVKKTKKTVADHPIILVSIALASVHVISYGAFVHMIESEPDETVEDSGDETV